MDGKEHLVVNGGVVRNVWRSHSEGYEGQKRHEKRPWGDEMHEVIARLE